MAGDQRGGAAGRRGAFVAGDRAAGAFVAGDHGFVAGDQRGQRGLFQVRQKN